MNILSHGNKSEILVELKNFCTYPVFMSILLLENSEPFSTGNKWYKLKYNLERAKSMGYTGLLSFGGAYSNHLAALATIGNFKGIKTIGVIRGEEHESRGYTLRFLKSQGMKLHFIGREMYKRRYEPEFLEDLSARFPDYFVVPEGGNNQDGVKGAAEIMNLVPVGYDIICSPVGTGSTLAGLIRSGYPASYYGFSALKGAQYLEGKISEYIGETVHPWKLFHQFHFGGFGKINEELIGFMREFYQNYNIKLDPVYTSKMMYGVSGICKEFPENSKILCIHTGGLQGLGGMEERLGFSIY